MLQSKHQPREPHRYWQRKGKPHLDFVLEKSCLAVCTFLCIYLFFYVQYNNSTKTSLFQGNAVKEPYPGWAMFVCLLLLMGGFLPIPIVYFMRRFQCTRFDHDIQTASIKRVETTMSTQGMIKSEEVRHPL